MNTLVLLLFFFFLKEPGPILFYSFIDLFKPYSGSMSARMEFHVFFPFGSPIIAQPRCILQKLLAGSCLIGTEGAVGFRAVGANSLRRS